MLRAGFAFTLALLLTPGLCFADDVATPPAEGHLRLGTWNLEHFGNRRGKVGTRTDEDIKAIAKFIESMHVDVLALQEINGDAPLKRLCGHLPGFEFVVGTTGGFYKNPKQKMAFLWNAKRVELVRAGELRFNQKAPKFYYFNRLPVMGVFRSKATGYDFRAIVVHFKAGRIKGRSTKHKNDHDPARYWSRCSACKLKGDQQKRALETRKLGTAIKGLLDAEGEDQDLVVLGDFNYGSDYPAYKIFDEFVDYLAPSDPKQEARTIMHFEERIDHITVSEGFKKDVVAGSFQIHNGKAKPDLKAWRKTYSDHVPVTVDINASTDDDEAEFSKAPVEATLEKNVDNNAKKKAEEEKKKEQKKKDDAKKEGDE